MLDRALQSLRPDHLLVLHERRGSTTDGYILRLLYQLKGVVFQEQRIHMHCLNGSSLAVKQWCGEFPHVHFGFTSLDVGKEAREALRKIEPSRLFSGDRLSLLEGPEDQLWYSSLLGFCSSSGRSGP